MASTEISTWNHVVVNRHGWSRGKDLKHALSKIEKEEGEEFLHFHFKNDDWDVYGGSGEFVYSPEILITREMLTYKKSEYGV